MKFQGREDEQHLSENVCLLKRSEKNQLKKNFRTIFRRLNYLHQKRKDKSICLANAWILICKLFFVKYIKL